MYKHHQNLIKIGRLIRKARLAKEVSQEVLAEKAGLGRTYMGRVERGEQNISVQNLIKIAFALRVELNDLFPKLKNLSKPPGKLN